MWGGQTQLAAKAGRLREDSKVQAIDKSTVIATLREYEQELKAAGIARLSVFGSVARGDQSLESDVDLVAEFDPAKQFSLLELVGLENRLADILDARVELTPAKTLRDPIRERVAREAVLVF
jgi:uncharacterized protein